MKRLLQTLALAALAIVSLAPFAALALDWFQSAEVRENSYDIFRQTNLAAAFLRGIASAAAAAVLAVAAGAALALIGLPRRRWILGAAILPLIIPPTVFGLGWNAIWRQPIGDWAQVGRCAFVMGLAYTPLCALVIAAAQRWSDSAANDSARLAGMGRARRMLAVRLPPLLPAIAIAALTAFALSISNFEIPGALNFHCIPEEIYSQFIATYSIGAPAALGLISALPALLAAAAIWRFSNNAPPPSAFAGFGSAGLASNGGSRPTLALTDTRGLAWLAYILIALAPAIFGLVYRQSGTATVSKVATDLAQGFRDTLPLVLAATALALVIAWLLADWLTERRLPKPSNQQTNSFNPSIPPAPPYAAMRSMMSRLSRLNRPTTFVLALLPAAVAPGLVAIGLIRFWNRPIFGDLVYGESPALVFAMTARFLPVSLLAFLALRQFTGREFRDTAALAGLSWTTVQSRLHVPAHMGAMATCAAATLVLAMGELGATTLLSAPGVELISFRLHSRVHIGPEAWVNTFSLLYAATTLLAGALLYAALHWATAPARKPRA